MSVRDRDAADLRGAAAAGGPPPAPVADRAAPAPARREIRPPDPEAVARVVASALAEDLVLGDPTTDGLFRPGDTATIALGGSCEITVRETGGTEIEWRVPLLTDPA